MNWRGCAGTEMEEYRYTLDLAVRDYECDMQGIVNNAVYQHYLEHGRHEFLKAQGLDFADFTRRQIHLVVVRAELDYKYSLRSGDTFWLGLNLGQESRLRFVFFQDIYRYPDHKPILKAKIIGTALNAKGRPELPPEFAATLR